MRTLLSRGLASAIDRAVFVTALSRGKASRARSPAESLGHEARVTKLGELAASIPESAFDAPASFFGAPRAPEVSMTRARRFGRGGEVHDLSWRSSHAPVLDAVRARYLAHQPSATAHARWFSIPSAARPVVIVVHGYLGGAYSFEEGFWPLRWLMRQGLDVALFVLPFHGPRKGPEARPKFPSSDPRMTIEGFRQAIADLRDLAAWLRSRGAPEIGVLGMSLGGYTAALAATVAPELSFAVPLVPLASIADFAGADGRFVGTPDEQRLQHDAVERVHAVVSPLSRPLALPPSRVAVVAGRVDRITPLSHAEKLAAHFRCRLEVFDGGHLVQAGRARALERISDVFRPGGRP